MNQSAVAPDSFTTLPHLTLSALMKAANWSGVSATTSPPCSAIFFFTSAWFSTLVRAACSLLSTGLGVAAGANMPNQDVAS